ncbi:hypothetical protein JJL45_01035 [Tamlana sp. s12]|uniref:hypothetical protein n=1 Tax=Tamlana sp. s12 TaxID=1630406 RepID=UPI000838DE02|nr:hypothetical protein [Tamlana sp. s12]QQY82610.1 hypothetical protein JJL45_01035 [Tamlana sp. s12]
MKLVSILIIVLMSLKTCGSLNTTKAKTQGGVSKEQQATSEDLITFEYLATTRNSYYKIRVIENLIVVSKKRGKPGPPVMLPQPEWERLLELLDAIPLSEIPKLKAPSKNYAFDGAAQTTLKVTVNEHTYQTQAFDEGNPPEAIKALVKEITDLATNME